jgi:hypothetical protein
MTMNKISIIIPVGVDKELHPNFQSFVTNPLLRDHEVIIIKDKREATKVDPETRQTLAQIAKLELDNLVFLEGSFFGAGESRNFGILHSRFDWIYFWDADDEPIVEAALEMVETAAKSDKKLAIGQAVRKKKDNLEEILISNSLWGLTTWPGLWRIAFHRSLIKGYPFLSWKWCEDQDFILRTISNELEVMRFYKVVYRYYQGVPNSATSVTSDWTYLTDFYKNLRKSNEYIVNPGIRHLFLLKTLLALMRHKFFLWLPRFLYQVPSSVFIFLREFKGLRSRGYL